MKVITENEIIVKKGDNMGDRFWSPATGSKKKGSLIDKAKGLIGSGKVQGVLAALNQGQGGMNTSVAPIAPPEPEKKGMSTGAKIGIGVGIAAVIGAIIYFVKKGKK
jgi:hypothetical protein